MLRRAAAHSDAHLGFVNENRADAKKAEKKGSPQQGRKSGCRNHQVTYTYLEILCVAAHDPKQSYLEATPGMEQQTLSKPVLKRPRTGQKQGQKTLLQLRHADTAKGMVRIPCTSREIVGDTFPSVPGPQFRLPVCSCAS